MSGVAGSPPRDGDKVRGAKALNGADAQVGRSCNGCMAPLIGDVFGEVKAWTGAARSEPPWMIGTCSTGTGRCV